MRLGPRVLVGNPGRTFLGARIKAGTAVPSLVFRQYDNENFAADNAALPIRAWTGGSSAWIVDAGDMEPGAYFALSVVRGFKDPVVPEFDGYVKPGLRMVCTELHSSNLFSICFLSQVLFNSSHLAPLDTLTTIPF